VEIFRGDDFEFMRSSPLFDEQDGGCVRRSKATVR